MNTSHQNYAFSCFKFTFVSFVVSNCEILKIVASKCSAEFLSSNILAGLFVMRYLCKKIFQVSVSVWIAVRKVATIKVTKVEGKAEGVVISDGYLVWSLKSTFVVTYIGARPLPHEVSGLTSFAPGCQHSHSIVKQRIRFCVVQNVELNVVTY